MNKNDTHKPPPLTMDPAILASFRQPQRDSAQAKGKHSTDTASPSTELDDGGAENTLPTNEGGDHTPPAEAGNPTTEETR